MKKLLLLTKTLLAVFLLMGGANSAWGQTTTYDFEDGNARFTAYNSSKITVTTIADPRDDKKKVASFAYKGKGAHNFAYLNFSDLAENAATVKIEFDFYVTTGAGHDLISLSDANFHTGALAGFDSNSNTGYGSYGTIFDLGCYRSGSNYFAINNIKADGTYTFLDQWCHADITVNNVAKTVSYTITNAASQEVTASGVSFYNRFAGRCTQIDVYMGATSSSTPIYLDNLSITPTVSSSYDYTINAVSGETTLKLLADGVAATEGNYSVSNLPKVIKYSDKYYVLDDNTVTGYTTQSYTMGAAKETKEIKYTLDETIVFYTEGETAFGETAINSAYSEGAYTNYAKKKTISTAIASAGIYRMETFVTARGAYKLYVYNSSDEEIARIAPGVGAFTGEANSSNFTLTEGATINIGAKSENSLSFDYVLIRKIGEVATIGSRGYATFSSKNPVNVDVTGLEAYIATGISGGDITMEKVTGNVAANTGLVLKGAAGNYALPFAASGTTYNQSSNPKNYLFALDGTFANVNVAGTGKNYVMVVQNDEVVWAPVTDGEHLAPAPAGHAALWLDGGGARSMGMSFVGDITAVENVDAAPAEAKAKDGKFIENGKLVIVKNGAKYNAAGAKLY